MVSHYAYVCLQQLHDAILAGDAVASVADVRLCLKGGVPADVMEQALLDVARTLDSMRAQRGPESRSIASIAECFRSVILELSPVLVPPEKPGGNAPGSIMLVTLPGDRDVGRIFWRLLLARRGYAIHDLGVRAAPIAAARAVDEGLDALALHVVVSSARSAVQTLIGHLLRRGSKTPVLLGGPGVDADFAQWVSFPQGGTPYWGGVYFCEDGREMLQVLKQIVLFEPPPPAHAHETPAHAAASTEDCAGCGGCPLASGCELL